DFANDGIKPVLVPDLNHERGMRLSRLDHLVALINRIRHRLFNKDVLTGVQGGNRGLVMKKERKGDDNCVQIFVLEHFSIVDEGPWTAACKIDALLQIGLENIADAGDPGRRQSGEVAYELAALGPGADDACIYQVIWTAHRSERESVGGSQQ